MKRLCRSWILADNISDQLHGMPKNIERLDLFRHIVGISRRVLDAVYEVSVRLGMPRVSGLILSLLAWKLRKKGAHFRLLCLSKPVFNDDVRAIHDQTESLEMIFFPRLHLKPIIKKYLGFYESLTDASYHVLTKDRPEVENVRQFLSAMFPCLLRLLRFDAILAGNFVYVTQQELFRTARQHNIPVIILYKEGMLPSDRYKNAKEVFYMTKVFLGDKILFYNERIRDTLIEANIPGLTREKTSVIGIPRIDRYFYTNVTSHNKTIVLFAFEPGMKAQYMLSIKDRKDFFYERVQAFHEAFIRFCIEHNDFQLTIKTKTNPTSIEHVQKIVSKYEGLSLCKNIIVTNTQDPSRLILDAAIVAGYASTTLLEALVAGRPILCPDFADIMNGKSFDYFEGFEDLVNYVKDYACLERFLLSGDRLKSPSFDRLRQFLEPMIHKLDGKASERAATEIARTITELQRVG